MSFRIREESRAWFTHIRDDLNVDFDVYYFCLMLGLAAKRKKDVPPSETVDFIDYFPGEYKLKGRLIVGLFLRTELEHLGVDMAVRKSVHDAVQRLVEPQSLSHLSDYGHREINKYSFAGFEVLLAGFDDRPRSLETFFPRYAGLLQATVAARSGAAR